MKSYADDELKFCFLLPIEDSDEEEVKSKLVKCESCQMMIKDCEMKNHLNTHNLSKPFHCEMKGCFKKFNTQENLELHIKYFHNNKDDDEENNDNYSTSNQRKIEKMKKKIKDILEIKNNDIFNSSKEESKEEFAIGKYIYEDKKGKTLDEKIFLCIEKNKENEETNENSINNSKQKRIVGYIENGLP